MEEGIIKGWGDTPWIEWLEIGSGNKNQ